MKVFFLLLMLPLASLAETLKVGAKQFPESLILSEIITFRLKELGLKEVTSTGGLGGTGILFNALQEGSLIAYPEYSGTITQAILQQPNISDLELKKQLEAKGILIGREFGFNNTYALAVKNEVAKKYKLEKISDLKRVPHFKWGVTYEFVERADGLKALIKAYGLDAEENVKPMEHALAYEAIEGGEVDLIDVYTTDSKITRYQLKTLIDDKNFFPRYNALILGNKAFFDRHPEVWKKLNISLAGSLNEKQMMALNSRVALEKWSAKSAAALHLGKSESSSSQRKTWPWGRILQLALEHVLYVLFSVIAAFLVGLPLGIIAFKRKKWGQVLLGGAGLIQTIPSLALLCFLIPFFGIGKTPAFIALFLYGLLPIIRGTYTGLISIPRDLQDCSQVLGVTSWRKVLWIEIPLASRQILAGVKLSAIINVGTAVLAAFIGGGGLGTLISSGLALNDNQLIMQGAIPSALLALGIQGVFEVVDKVFIPEGVKLS